VYASSVTSRRWLSRPILPNAYPDGMQELRRRGALAHRAGRPMRGAGWGKAAAMQGGGTSIRTRMIAHAASQYSERSFRGFLSSAACPDFRGHGAAPAPQVATS